MPKSPSQILLALALTGCSVFGVRSGTPEPAYQVVTKIGPVEIRQYAPKLAASVTVQGDEIAARATGFRRLAAFIFGANTANTSIEMTAPVVQSSAKIAMTAPVAQAAAGPGQWTISFYMPAGYTAATLPRPKDQGIVISELPGALDAVIRFTGIPGKAPAAAAREELLATLANSPYVPDGPPEEWFYDPPWTIPFLRRNEIAVPVALRAN